MTTGATPGEVEAPTVPERPADRVRLVDPPEPASHPQVELEPELEPDRSSDTAPEPGHGLLPVTEPPAGSIPADVVEPVVSPAAPTFPVTDRDTGSADSVAFGFNLAKIAGQGEDADPLLHRARDLGIVGVFDGMGGAGGTVYETPDGPRTGAYLASRIVREVVERHLTETIAGGWDLGGPAVADALHRVIGTALAEALAALHAPRSGLRSTLIRALPTTMAVAVVQRREEDGQVWGCHLFWAGDSRVYVVDPAAGAAQLTADDIRDRSDAMANLRADSVLSNAISADTPFVVRHRRLDLTVPFVLVAATDGAFGYLPSPMHFEHLLLASLRSAADVDEWSSTLQHQISAVTGDDAALAVLAQGADRASLRDLCDRRTQQLENDYVRPIDGLSIDLQRLELEVEILRNRAAEVSADLWAAYRPSYERHLVDPTGAAE